MKQNKTDFLCSIIVNREKIMEVYKCLMCSEERKYENRKCQIIKTDKLGNFNKSNIHKLRMYALNPNCSVIYAMLLKYV